MSRKNDVKVNDIELKTDCMIDDDQYSFQENETPRDEETENTCDNIALKKIKVKVKRRNFAEKGKS